MPLFRYTVEDSSGKTLNGVMQALDESDLSGRLTSMGYTLRGVVVAGAAPVASSPAATPASNAPRGSAARDIPPSLEPRIAPRSLATYMRQMASLIRSGLAPYQATGEVLSRTRSRRLRRALESMQAQALSGGAISPVMTAHPDIFPTKIVGLIYCGELGGFMDTALDEAATNIEQEIRQHLLPRLVAGLVRLNVIILILSLPLVRLDLIFPRLAQLAKPDDSTGQSVHNAVRAMRETYSMGAFAAISLTTLFIAATYIWPHIKRIPAVRVWMDGFILKMPIWGSLQMSRSLYSFGKALGQLYSAGISPSSGWAAASATCLNSVIANKIRSAGAVLSAGGPFSTAVEEAGVFDENARALLISGERAGDIPGMLQKVTQSQEELAGSHHTKGRWISVHLVLCTLIALTGIFAILIVKAYVEGIFKVPDALLGGH